ncbi:MAG: rhombosortase [Deltaproteobacteria bacterium]|nr:rhombosortase [Deltaproteobacteria bacterium]
MGVLGVAATRTPLWTLSLIALSICASLIPELADHLAAETIALCTGQLWRLLGGPLIHGSPSHLLRDLSVLCVLGPLVEHRLARAQAALFFCAALALPALLTLALRPDLGVYCGLSGLDHALAAFLLVDAYRANRRWPIALLAGLLALKLAFETASGDLLFPLDMGELVPAPEAHLAGAALGAYCAWV